VAAARLNLRVAGNLVGPAMLAEDAGRDWTTQLAAAAGRLAVPANSHSFLASVRNSSKPLSASPAE